MPRPTACAPWPMARYFGGSHDDGAVVGADAFGKATGPCGNAAGWLSGALVLSSSLIVIPMIRCRLHWHAFGVKLKGRTDATFAVVHSPGFAVSSIIMGFAVA